MEEQKYPFSLVSNETRYEFISTDGIKEIKKVVVITEVDNNILYNLALLDELENGELSDISESRNKGYANHIGYCISNSKCLLRKISKSVNYFQGK
jgi:hypothetical protein